MGYIFILTVKVSNNFFYYRVAKIHGSPDVQILWLKILASVKAVSCTIAKTPKLILALLTAPQCKEWQYRNWLICCRCKNEKCLENAENFFWDLELMAKKRNTFTTIEPLLVWNEPDNSCNFVAGKIRRGANTKNF